MTVIPSQHGLIDEGNNAVRLAKYAQLTQMECAFFGVLDPSEPVDDACSPILTLPEREQISRYLGEAQDEIEQVVGYPLTPRWFVDELPFACTIHAKRTKVIEAGVEASEVVALGRSVNYATDPTIVLPVATSVIHADEIRVYHPGTEIEIDPSFLEIAAGVLSIEIPICRLVDAAHVDNPQAGLDYTDVPPSATSPFEATVDIMRVYNDPYTQATLVWPHKTGTGCSCGCWSMVCGEFTHEGCAYIRNGATGAIDVLYAHLVGSTWTANCPCVCSAPEIVRVYYRAGLTAITKQAEDAIIHLAHAKMPRPSCGCGILRDKWDIDRKIPDTLTAERINCPFGCEDGAWKAWLFANAMKTYRVGIL